MRTRSLYWCKPSITYISVLQLKKLKQISNQWIVIYLIIIEIENFHLTKTLIGSWTHVHTLIRSPTQTNTRALHIHLEGCTPTQAVTPTYACICTSKKENNRTHKQKQAHSTHAHKRNPSRTHSRKNIFKNTQSQIKKSRSSLQNTIVSNEQENLLLQPSISHDA